MVDLSKARGLNSIADPRQFKGAPGRGGRRQRPAPPDPGSPLPASDDDEAEGRPAEPSAFVDADRRERADPAQQRPERRTSSSHSRPAPRRDDRSAGSGPSDTDTGRASDGADHDPHQDSARRLVDEAPVVAPAIPHRAVTPGIQRKRRELSIPHELAEVLAATRINPADVVMAGYRKHADAIYAGEGGRLLARGRTRLRLSISDKEFDQLTRLGVARGWNRSETVSVILAMELLPDPTTTSAGASPEG
jgi:hypothetical protein